MIYILSFLLLAVGLYGALTKRDAIKVVIALLIMEHASHLLLLLIGYRSGGVSLSRCRYADPSHHGDVAVRPHPVNQRSDVSRSGRAGAGNAQLSNAIHKGRPRRDNPLQADLSRGGSNKQNQTKSLALERFCEDSSLIDRQVCHYHSRTSGRCNPRRKGFDAHTEYRIHISHDHRGLARLRHNTAEDLKTCFDP